MCGEKKEDKEHYEHGCGKVGELRHAAASKAGREQLSLKEWQLAAEGMKEDLIVRIAKVRWIYIMAGAAWTTTSRRR